MAALFGECAEHRARAIDRLLMVLMRLCTEFTFLGMEWNTTNYGQQCMGRLEARRRDTYEMTHDTRLVRLGPAQNCFADTPKAQDSRHQPSGSGGVNTTE